MRRQRAGTEPEPREGATGDAGPNAPGPSPGRGVLGSGTASAPPEWDKDCNPVCPEVSRSPQHEKRSGDPRDGGQTDEPPGGILTASKAEQPLVRWRQEVTDRWEEAVLLPRRTGRRPSPGCKRWSPLCAAPEEAVLGKSSARRAPLHKCENHVCVALGPSTCGHLLQRQRFSPWSDRNTG